jgi:hypothetical protein
MLMFLLHIIENLRVKFSIRTFLMIRAISRLVRQKMAHEPFNPKDQATVISYVYNQLPARYKAPDGPVAEEELTAVIQAIIGLYDAGRLLSRK